MGQLGLSRKELVKLAKRSSGPRVRLRSAPLRRDELSTETHDHV